MTSISRFSLPEIFPVTADVAARYFVNREYVVDAAPAGVAASGSAHGLMTDSRRSADIASVQKYAIIS